MDSHAFDQLGFWDRNGLAAGRISGCPVSEYVEEWDSACLQYKISKFETLSCGTKKGAEFLSDIKGGSLNNIRAIKQKIPTLPNFIPEFQHGSGYLIKNVKLNVFLID